MGTVDSGLISFTVVPTRGMSIRDVVVKDSTGAQPLGWTSPVRENVHPRHIALYEFGGLGMLQGFSEFYVSRWVRFHWSPSQN